ncbi:MAG: hypothetical protein NC548_12880 [Lachnospiraceae bacterium]|nr:hypothetical protein [Lachnospiraceae bacterium]MCM1230715.1 hypothetical protein [Ruminococcus flavefaciens]
MMTQPKSKWFTIETIIVLAIAGCMIFLINFANAKMEEITISNKEALLMNHDPDDPIHTELAEEIVKFRPDACKLIEVYSEELEPMFSVQFYDNNDGHTDINDFPDLISLLRSNVEGHTEITIDGIDENVYFRWSETSKGEHYLVIVYMSQPIVSNLWVFPLVCYLILLMVFILLIRIRFIQHNERIKYYDNISRSMRE